MFFRNASIIVSAFLHFFDNCFYLSVLLNKILSIETTNMLTGIVAALVSSGAGNAS